ncbi:MAG: CBS domain-containing protein [Desulfobacteraceae bacterium]|nr:CBS domain-containing protein [Desulfobacteraceae bacterium]
MDLITTHLNADFDGFASMVAAKRLYPEAVLAFSGAQEKTVRDYFGQSEHVFELRRPKDVLLEQVTRLIVVDTRQPDRIGNFAQCLGNPGIEDHLYDHHPDAPGDMKGKVEVVQPVGATATILTRLFEKKRIEISQAEATLLALAIFEDTGFFAFEGTTPEDFMAMAWLLGRGADLHAVSRFLAKELTAEQVRLLHELIKAANTYTIQGIDIVIAKITLPGYVDELALLVQRVMVMENLNVLFALASMDDRVYLIARSRIPEVNAGIIARDLGGGGHASAASATIKNMTLSQAEEELLLLLHRHVRPVSLARELMSAPVISVRPEVALREANDLLTRYNITVLPVIGAEGELQGLISRRVVEKAIYHGLGELPVTEYMTTELATLPPTATLADIQEIIIDHRQRFIPVEEEGRIIGVITRTDLLNMLVNDPAHLPRNLLEEPDRPSGERHRNLRQLMIETLPREMVVLLRTIGEAAAAGGFTAYAVGGFVRDLLLHQKNFDLDIVIEGDGIEFARRLAGQLGGTMNSHEKFGTAVVKLPDGFTIDVATARLEYYEYPAAMPTVELSSIKLDLYRRDFTINAMAVHLNPNRFGTLVDFFNCQNDIKERRIRVLHNLSFVEDPTRIFRAVRFEQRMQFRLGGHTERLLKGAVKMDLFNRAYGRRFFNELRLILAEKDPLPIIRRLAQLDLLKFLHPGLQLDQRLANILEDTQRTLDWYRLLYLEVPCLPWLVYLLALLARATAKEVMEFCERLEVPERYRTVLLEEKVNVAKIVRTFNQRSLLQPSEIYWLLQDLTEEGLLHLMSMTRKKAGKKAVSGYVTTLRHVRTELRGADLKEMGYPPGPLYRTILNHLLEARLDGRIHNRADEIELVRRDYPLTRSSSQG